MIGKWLTRILIGLGVVVLAATVLIGLAIYDTWYKNNYKEVIQTLEAPRHNMRFVLLTDIAGFGDRSWYVYQLPIGADITRQMRTGHDREGVLFWNYSEAGDHYDNPRIEILNEKYLVFSRGGLYHSLYDIDEKQVLVNDESPWNSFMSSNQNTSPTGTRMEQETMKSQMDTWVRMNLHSAIEKILTSAT